MEEKARFFNRVGHEGSNMILTCLWSCMGLVGVVLAIGYVVYTTFQ